MGIHNGWTYVSELEEVQLMVSSDAGKAGGSLKLGHKRTGSTGSAKSAFCAFNLLARVFHASWKDLDFFLFSRFWIVLGN